MHLLYLDDAGSAPNRDEDYFVLGGLSVFEAQAHWFTQELDKLAQGIDPGNPHRVEFHASEIFARRVLPWKSMTRNEAQGVIKSVLKVLADSQDMARNFRLLGTRWGVLRNLADTPFFVDSRASRLVQMADHVAYATYRRYQAGDTQYFDIIAQKFHSVDGVIHGLAHKELGCPNCMCIACFSRRLSGGREAGGTS